MSKYFNIGGPCCAADHYMLAATERLPEVVSLVDKGQYFVVHAPRQCGKTTMFLGLANEINAKGEKLALYCTVETVQELIDPSVGLPEIANVIRRWACLMKPDVFGRKAGALGKEIDDANTASCVQSTLQYLAEKARKTIVLFIDEVDCLSKGTLITFLRQLRSGKISSTSGAPFPTSIALIGMRNIRDYMMRVRQQCESTGEASPFNVISEAMRLRVFTEAEMRALYAQHTAATGQVFEEGALAKAWTYSQGQPYLVNALARWCLEKIHKEDFSRPVTADDVEEAKEKIIRERVANLNSIWKRVRTTWMVKAMDAVGRPFLDPATDKTSVLRAMHHGVLSVVDGLVVYSCPLVEESVNYYSRGLTREVA